jgi:hypothetical protein
MRKYVTMKPRPRMAHDDWMYEFTPDMETNVTVFEREPEPVFSGIYDANGAALYSIEERDPIGFKVTS